MTGTDWGQLKDVLLASLGKNNFTNWISPPRCSPEASASGTRTKTRP